MFYLLTCYFYISTSKVAGNVFESENCNCNITLYFQVQFHLTNLETLNNLCLAKQAQLPGVVRAVLYKAKSGVGIVINMAHVFVIEMLANTINTYELKLH